MSTSPVCVCVCVCMCGLVCVGGRLIFTDQFSGFDFFSIEN